MIKMARVDMADFLFAVLWTAVGIKIRNIPARRTKMNLLYLSCWKMTVSMTKPDIQTVFSATVYVWTSNVQSTTIFLKAHTSIL